MQRFIFATAAVAAVSASFTPAEKTLLTVQLNDWLATYGAEALPTGVTEAQTDELLNRVAAANAVIAKLTASQPHATFGLGPMSLYTPEEFKAHLGRSFKRAGRALRSAGIDYSTLPASTATDVVDWTTSKCVNPIKNQGKCGSCWAFSATGAIESAHCIATGKLLDLSEQQVVSCENKDGQQGCNGGDEELAINWITGTNKGLCLTKDYPYTSGTTTVNGECLKTCTVQPVSVGEYVETPGEASLEKDIVVQPTTVAVEAGNDAWQHYKNGVVTACPGAESDHAVIALGYGAENGVNYFKIRNSWGAKWGEAGHIRLQRGVGGKGMCNVAEYPAYPKILGTPAPTTKPAC
ncbi:cysteine protease family C01A [Achlya hypogyna]|uniref:Cysteine protease family C01A n=1 Tax=Achlya hypogyna TaxID=1202772 RepID=A0A0A7CMH4_ACHHY|nr:secreted protein [Achlya hypogyna]OQR88890.1 cysteine protease family C01A [Achlya hypogyna]